MMADPKSWNPWHGCRRYSEGCKFCYMFVLDKAHHVPELSTPIVHTKMFSKPLEMTKRGYYKIPSGYTLRVNMTSDTFLEEADEWHAEMWSIIRKRPDVIFYILTKRVSDDCQKYRVNFTVDVLGSHFVKDGKMYHLDSQELQGKQAYRSGLSHFFSKPKYKLYSHLTAICLKSVN